MTIPQAISNVQDHAFGKAKENSLMKIKEATSQMKVNGVLSGYSSNIAFVEEFKQYMSVIKTCSGADLNKCFPAKFKTSQGKEFNISDLATGDKLSSKNLTDNTVAMMLKNGTTILFSLRDASLAPNECKEISAFDNTSNTTSCMSFFYDINGFKGPNVAGRDIGVVNVSSKFACFGYSTSDGTCFAGAFIPTPLTLSECNAQRLALGISECSSNTDYWAGAVAQCGGVSNMPTQEQLGRLATELYGVTCGIGFCSGTPDYNKAQSIGLPSSGSFSVWSSFEYTSTIAYFRSFNSGNSYSDANARSFNIIRAVCTGDVINH